MDQICFWKMFDPYNGISTVTELTRKISIYNINKNNINLSFYKSIYIKKCIKTKHLCIDLK